MSASIRPARFGLPVARRVGGAVLSALFAVMYVAGPVAAASVTFDTPSASASFLKNIVFTQPYSGGPITSATILIEFPGDIGPSVAAVQQVGSGTLVYTLDTSSGGVYPNTPIVAHFEVLLADGSTQVGPDIHITYVDDRIAWKTKAGKVVRLHYANASDSFAQSLLGWADAGIQKAATFFGVTETSPIDFFIYGTQSSFQAAMGQADTVGGVALPEIRSCFALVTPGDTAYGQSVTAHEVTHIAFGDATSNPYHSPPRWLNEGLAVYMSDGYDASNRSLVSQAVRAGTLRSLFALSDFFPYDATRIFLAYAESVSAVDFMVRKYGQPAVAKLVKAYAKGVTDDEAFTGGIGVNVAAFNTAWLSANGVTSTKYGPQPAPTGPLPPGWNGSGAGSTANPQPTDTGSAATPAPTQVPVLPSSATADDQSAYLVAAIIAVVGFIMLALAGLLATRSGGRKVS
jgi:hypothetical protein